MVVERLVDKTTFEQRAKVKAGRPLESRGRAALVESEHMQMARGMEQQVQCGQSNQQLQRGWVRRVKEGRLCLV